MTSDLIRKLSRELHGNKIVDDHHVVEHNRILFDRDYHSEVQHSLKDMQEGMSEETSNDKRQEEIQDLPEYDELGGLAQDAAHHNALD